MTPSEIDGKLAYEIIRDIILIGACIAAYLRSSNRATVKQISEVSEGLHDDMATLNNRVTIIEVGLDHAPNRADIEDLHTRISDVRKEVLSVGKSATTSAAYLEGISKTLDILVQEKMRGGKK